LYLYVSQFGEAGVAKFECSSGRWWRLNSNLSGESYVHVRTRKSSECYKQEPIL